MKIRNIKFIKEIRYAFASFPKRGKHRLFFRNPPSDYNPIINKTLQKKTLDNENFSESLENIMKHSKKEEENNDNLFSELNLDNILKEFTAEDKLEFTPKKTKGFKTISECFEYLEKNQQDFPNEVMKYAESLFYTVIDLEAKTITEFLENENNLIILKHLYSELEKETRENGFIPIIKDNKNEDLKKILEINELAQFFSLILEKFIAKHLLNTDLKKIFNILRSFENFFYFSLLKDEFKQKIRENLKIFFNEVNKNLNKFIFKEKISLCLFMKATKFYDANFLDYMTIYCDLNFENIEIFDILLILSLNNNIQQSIPYELLYKLKKRILKLPRENLQPKVLLRILKVYSKKRLYYMENFYEIVYNEIISDKIFNNLAATDYVLLLYYYSNSFYRDENFFQRVLLKIEKYFKAEDSFYFRLILLSLAQLNFMTNEFFLKLKENINILETIEKLKSEDLSNDQKRYFNLLIQQFQEIKDETNNLDSQQISNESSKNEKSDS